MSTSMSRRTSSRRRAVVAVQVMVLISVLLGFAALTIDLGTMFRARGDLQDAADSAAMAGVSAFTSDAMLRVRLTPTDSNSFNEALQYVRDRARDFSQANYTLGEQTNLLITSDDLKSGWIDLNSASSPLDPLRVVNEFNAVQVVVRRDSSADNQANKPITYYLAPLMGINQGSAVAMATAAFDDRFAGLAVGDGTSNNLPLSTDEALFSAGFALPPGPATDNYSYDDVVEAVNANSDGVNEINIFPGANAPGNFGLLNIGSPNQGNPALALQIENGVTSADMEAEIGTSDVTFYDGAGNPTTYQMTGSPGMKNGLIPSFELQVGEVISFYLHNAVVQQGQNATYTISGMQFGRLMNVNLTGPPSGRGIWIQPLIYSGSDVLTAASAPSSNGMVGKIVLVR